MYNRTRELSILQTSCGRSENFHSTDSGRQSDADSGKDWDVLLQQMRSAKPSPADKRIIHKLKSGGEGELFRLLFLGYWEGASVVARKGPYRSCWQAVQVLLNRIARLTDGDPCRMYAIFKETVLYKREKLENQRFHLIRTILTAIDDLGWPSCASN